MATRTKPRPTPTQADSSAAAAPAPAGTYRQVPLADLRANPLNGRRKLTDIDDLAASIRQLGILEPLLVVPADDGLLIVSGHRRHAAADQAGLPAVPCIVRTDMDEAHVLQASIVENNQRANLTYTEEAEQLRRLMDLRTLTVTDLATAVGRPPAYVTGRLALLTLPDRARDALDTATITLDVAARLTDLSDHPDLIDDLIDTTGHVDPDLLDAACARIATDREAERLTAEATAKGLRLVTLQPGNRHLATLDLTPAQAGAHRRQTCHAVHLDRTYGKPRLVPLCTDPARHRPPAAADTSNASGGTSAAPDGAGPVTAGAKASGRPGTPAVTDRQRQEREHDRNRRRVGKARRTFLVEALGKRVKRADATLFALTGVLDRASQNDLSQAGALLGLTATTTRYGQKDWRAAITTYATTDADHLVKAAFAVACTWAETQVSPYTGYNDRVAAYITALAGLGHTPDPYETEQIAAYRQRQQPQPAADPAPASEPADDSPETSPAERPADDDSPDTSPNDQPADKDIRAQDAAA